MTEKVARGKVKPDSLRPDLQLESAAGWPGSSVIGVDEVGRGCLAGPVVAGAVLLPDVVDYTLDPWLAQVRDSKLVDAVTREALAPRIRAWAKAWGVGVATVEEIDRINIFHASHLAMRRAVEQLLGTETALSGAPRLLVDGKFLPRDLPYSATAIIKGDQKALSIACASILAKVWRDQRMVELDVAHPGYGFAAHKGYGTPVHVEALRTRGASIVHRRSFSPVAKVLGLAPRV